MMAFVHGRFKGVREIYDSDKFEIVTEGNKQILIVKNIYGEDADEYSVRATNRGGSRVSRAELEIRCKLFNINILFNVILISTWV